MKGKAVSLFVLMTVLGTVFYALFATTLTQAYMIRCFYVTIAVYLIGDFFFFFVFRLPFFNYNNIGSYFKNEILGQAGFMLVFGFAWGSLNAFFISRGYTSYTAELIMSGGLIPTIYYFINHMRDFNVSEREERLLKRKL